MLLGDDSKRHIFIPGQCSVPKDAWPQQELGTSRDDDGEALGVCASQNFGFIIVPLTITCI